MMYTGDEETLRTDGATDSWGEEAFLTDIRPFSAIHYAPELRLHLEQLVTPPYDVISPEQQRRYYNRHPQNIIRLELGQDQPGDDRLNNRYTRAAATFAEWRM